ncbi:MAG: tandem-95 repeat protein, partial [Desulfobulbaceae bacterium]|nr:tandem-95 repeat protein [Desulfobulbaceae bacterium]
SWTIAAAPALNQNGGPVTITVTVNDGTTTTDETFDITVTADNDAPTITAISNQTITEDGTTNALAFSVGDIETADGSLTVTASSSNTTIIPDGNLTLVDLGSGSWTIAASPALNQNGGPVTITVTVNDGTTTTDETFDITVTADNDAPTITAIANQTIAEDGTTGVLAFSVGDIETADSSLTVTASSNNTTIIPDGNLTLVDLGSGNWTIAAAPALNQNGGPVTITVTVDDGTTSTDETFDITVTAENDAPTTSPIILPEIAEDSGARTITQSELLANASDIEGDGLTVSALTIITGTGNLVDNGDGTWDYTPAVDWSGAVVFNYLINDGTTTIGNTANLTVVPVNDASVDDNNDESPDDSDDIPVDDFETDQSGDEEPGDEETRGEDEISLPGNPSDLEVIDQVSITPDDQSPTYLDGLNQTSPHANTSTSTDQERTEDGHIEKILNNIKIVTEKTLELSSSDPYQEPTDPGGLVVDNEIVRSQVELMHQQMDQSYEELAKENKTVVYITGGVSASIAAGAMSYLLRAGSLMSSFLATVPIWKGFDPVAVLLFPKKKKKKGQKSIDESIDLANNEPDQKAEDMFSKKENQ